MISQMPNLTLRFGGQNQNVNLKSNVKNLLMDKLNYLSY